MLWVGMWCCSLHEACGDDNKNTIVIDYPWSVRILVVLRRERRHPFFLLSFYLRSAVSSDMSRRTIPAGLYSFEQSNEDISGPFE